jgi:murein DD-endopeptidase MepM/ murein hydrolase activator NlpD
VLPSGLVTGGGIQRGLARAALAAMVAGVTLPLLAHGAEADTLEHLRARMDAIQEELDATTRRIENLRAEVEEARRGIAFARARSARLERRIEELQRRAAARADELYRDGGTGMLEVLFSADDFGELADRAQMLSEVSLTDATVFVSLARSKLELRALTRALVERREELQSASAELVRESDRLQEQFDAVAAEYQELKDRLAAASRRREAAASPAPAPLGALAAPVTGGRACPVAGAVSFVDSWGEPRDGHVHQGVDLMAAYGTPVVAIVSGTVTYSSYDGSGGNMIFLSGDDGNAYWYMHNQENLVSGGHVDMGQQIATVGDTGNAEGTPHLHFEYHPGGGGPVNPYPLVAAIC